MASSPSEVEFFAENELLTIIPNFNSKSISLMRGEIGPFRSGQPIDVPLWVGIILKQKNKCKIECPFWMDVDFINEKKTLEISENVLSLPISPYYMEVSRLLFRHANNDIPRSNEVSVAIKDLWDIRTAKLKSSLDKLLEKQQLFAQIDNVSSMEINYVRSSMLLSMDYLQRFSKFKS